ncbi:hypothetical protein ACZ87_02888 [Candidatus Erwinia dacicola]|uniref:Lipoprotein n=1 Tax=Candidatus Erwinia dacicola TaxID=252393 RepID=A0A328TIL7_9GAMM|nr:hypothetical protein ACZ87_02888 [Candidatus Erwinia dacicola]
MAPRLILFSLIRLGLTGCSTPARQAATAPAACALGDAMIQTTLYFGLNRPQGAAILEAEWQGFVDGEVTPRVKDGLTVFAAQGQWLGNDGKLTRESSKAADADPQPG